MMCFWNESVWCWSTSLAEPVFHNTVTSKESRQHPLHNLLLNILRLSLWVGTSSEEEQASAALISWPLGSRRGVFLQQRQGVLRRMSLALPQPVPFLKAGRSWECLGPCCAFPCSQTGELASVTISGGVRLTNASILDRSVFRGKGLPGTDCVMAQPDCHITFTKILEIAFVHLK